MKKKLKKIAIVTGSLETGGAEAMVAQLAANINKTRYVVKVICISKSVNSPVEQLLNDKGIDVIFLGKEEGVKFRTFFQLGKILSKFKPDIVHTHLSGAIYSYPWVFFHKAKMIHTLHTIPENEFSKLIQKLLRFYYKSGKATLVTVSPENQRSAAVYNSLHPTKIKMIFNPVDTQRFYKSLQEKEDFIFINVGRQDINKNQVLIIKALKELISEKTKAKLILIGDGNQNLKLKEKAKELGIENDIIFTGIIKDIEEYLAKADVYIQSSQYEGLPLSILEAMAAKLPIISTNVGGISDIVTDNGILIENNNLDQLVNAMRKLIKNKELHEEMSINSFRNVQRFDSKKMASQYCELYGEKSN